MQQIFNFTGLQDSNDSIFRRRTLYPAELQTHVVKLWEKWCHRQLMSVRLGGGRSIQLSYGGVWGERHGFPAADRARPSPAKRPEGESSRRKVPLILPYFPRGVNRKDRPGPPGGAAETPPHSGRRPRRFGESAKNCRFFEKMCGKSLKWQGKGNIISDRMLKIHWLPSR